MITKIKVYLWTLPRWFATPWFAGNVLLGALLAGGINGDAWLGFAAGMFLMAAGHTWNSALDWAYGLDKGSESERSAEKNYTSAQNLIEKEICSLREVMMVALTYDAAGFLFIGLLFPRAGWPIIIIGLAAAVIPWFYTWGKFNWFHETALFIGTGPVAVLLGMFAVNPSPPVIAGILAGIPTAITLTYLGLSFDEWLDARANLGKGVKSLAYMVWRYNLSLEWYISAWLFFLFLVQVLLIIVDVLAPMTAITMILFPFAIACLVLMKSNFAKAGAGLVIVGGLYPIFLLVGQLCGG
jgi:1,4-dihydroxy-2-naphthoate octaprenyltransferase